MTDSEVILIEQRIAAPPASVFRYLTESALWSRWQGKHADLEPRPGGRFRVTMGDGATVEGEYVEVQRDTRVVITWGWQEHPRMPPGSTTVEFDLIPEGDGTLVRLRHRGLPPEDLPIDRMGWDAFLPRLDKVARGVDPGPDPI